MSTNILKWKTKKIENLRIPMSAFYLHERTDWHPEFRLIDYSPPKIKLVNADYDIEGFLRDYQPNVVGKEGILEVTEIDIHGEGSGTFKHWILDEALKQSTGILSAVLIWEGAEVWKLEVGGGEVVESEIEF